MAKRVNGNGNGEKEVRFKVFEDLDDIPEIIRPKRESRYLPVIKAMLENPKKLVQVWGASASGLRNAIEREFPEESYKFTVAERKRRLYAVYNPDAKPPTKKEKPD